MPYPPAGLKKKKAKAKKKWFIVIKFFMFTYFNSHDIEIDKRFFLKYFCLYINSSLIYS